MFTLEREVFFQGRHDTSLFVKATARRQLDLMKHTARISTLWAMSLLGAMFCPAHAQLTHPVEPLTNPGVVRIGTWGDNDRAYALTIPGKTFSFYGTTYSTLTLTDNGVLTFGNTNYLTTNPSNLGMPRGSFPGVWVAQDDWLQPDISFTPQGYIYYKIYSDGVAFTWANVRRGDGAGGGATNTFQAILYNNGDIGLAYDDLNKVNNYVVGLNKGAGGIYASLTGVNTGTTAFTESNYASVSKTSYLFRYNGTNYLASRTFAVSGTLQLEAIVNTAPPQPFEFTFRKTGSLDLVVSANVPASGVFALPGIPVGTYVMHVKGPRYLAKNVNLSITNSNAVLPSPVPTFAGDINGDNAVDFGDLSQLLQLYNALEGDPLYSSASDINLDGGIDFGDLSSMLQNYNAFGDD